jgi:hypothetical protein
VASPVAGDSVAVIKASSYAADDLILPISDVLGLEHVHSSPSSLNLPTSEGKSGLNGEIVDRASCGGRTVWHRDHLIDPRFIPRSSRDAGNPDALAAFPRAAGPTIAFVLFLAAASSVVLSFTRKFCHRARIGVYRATVRLKADGKDKHWLLTAYGTEPTGGTVFVPGSPGSESRRGDHPSPGSVQPSEQDGSAKQDTTQNIVHSENKKSHLLARNVDV